MTSPRFTIYCHTNRVNGKRYVGQTVHSMEKRWGHHVALAKSKNRRHQAFANAIRKHGADAFDHQILEVVSTQESADSAECRWIEQLNCRVPNGYNLKPGGGRRGHHDNTRKLIREASLAQHQKMTAEERKIAAIPRIEGLHAWWESLSAEEYTALKRQRSEESRARWGRMTAEERRTQQRKGKTFTPEKLSANALKGWDTRRARYGQNGGVGCTLTREQRIEKIQKAWVTRRAKYGELGRADVTGRYSRGAEHALKTREAASREAKSSRLVRINLLSPSP